MTRSKMMSDLRTRILPLFRRSSTTSSAKSTASSVLSSGDGLRTRSKVSLPPAKRGNNRTDARVEEEKVEDELSAPSTPLRATTVSTAETRSVDPIATPEPSPYTQPAATEPSAPLLTVEEPTPDLLSQSSHPARPSRAVAIPSDSPAETAAVHGGPPNAACETATSHPRGKVTPAQQTGVNGGFAPVPGLGANSKMMYRKIWVKRPGASGTLVQINEEDLVDDVRDMILKKYANSLGRSFDSPDVTLRILPRQHSHRHSNDERTLGPEEPMARTLDLYYPGGQTVDEALIIDVPRRHTPRHSPRVPMPYHGPQEDTRPAESDQGYFPIMPGPPLPSPHLATSISVAGSSGSGHHHNSMSVINTGQIQPLPSPGSRAVGRHGGHRPRMQRNNTSSPTAVSTGVSQTDTRGHATNAPALPALPTPPLATASQVQRSATPPPRPSSPRPGKGTKRGGKRSNTGSALPNSLLDGMVPPINVLIVEDNIINLKLLEAFMKRLKVRWHTAMNGRDAVTKWRDGGFHLVLMDIQLPIMNGLDATKEIRRLESVNGVGVWGVKGSGDGQKGGTPGQNGSAGEPAASDKLKNTELFKSPVIIVALTASSLQSDRHEALAAGCNDFLTKPVNFLWLERKVTEWGCMQALIDFDGWRKWKDFSSNPANARAVASGKPALVSDSTVTTPASPPTADTTAENTPVTGSIMGAQNGSVPLAPSSDPTVPAGSLTSSTLALANAAGDTLSDMPSPADISNAGSNGIVFPMPNHYSLSDKTPTASSTNLPTTAAGTAANGNGNSASPPPMISSTSASNIHRPSPLSTLTNSSPPHNIAPNAVAPPPPPSSTAPSSSYTNTSGGNAGGTAAERPPRRKRGSGSGQSGKGVGGGMGLSGVVEEGEGDGEINGSSSSGGGKGGGEVGVGFGGRPLKA